MAVVLTSFKMSKKFSGEKFSISRFQPKGFSFPELKFLAAIDKEGRRMALRNYIDPVAGYAQALRDAFKCRWGAIKKWLDSLTPDVDIVLCCWCPYSDATAEQMKEFGTFACHSGLIGLMIAKHRPDIQIVLDRDREEHLLPEWKPNGTGPQKGRRFTEINTDMF